MKSEIKKIKKPNDFKPFILSITIETPQEARMLFHLCNHSDLGDVITKRHYYGHDDNRCFDNDTGNGYDDDICEKLPINEQLIHKELDEQGFSMYKNGRFEYPPVHN